MNRFKIVYRNYENELESCCRNKELVDPKYMVIYPVNQWVEPKIVGSKLFCFMTLDAAISFIESTFIYENLARMECWECEVEDESKPTKLRSCWTDCSLKHFWELFNSNSQEFNGIDGVAPPPKTVMVSRLKLLKKVG